MEATPPGQKEPAGHGAQADDSAALEAEVVPGGQDARAPFTQYEPEGHGRHAALDALPVLGLNFPAAQMVHDAAPALSTKPPGAHERQAEMEALPVLGLNVPAGHSSHAEGAAAPTKALYVPARQLVQAEGEAAPVALDHVPAGQGSHVGETMAGHMSQYAPPLLFVAYAPIVTRCPPFSMHSASSLFRKQPLPLTKVKARQPAAERQRLAQAASPATSVLSDPGRSFPQHSVAPH